MQQQDPQYAKNQNVSQGVPVQQQFQQQPQMMMQQQPVQVQMMQPVQMVAINNDDAKTMHLQPQIVQYQSKASCWKTTSVVFFILSILLMIVGFSSKNPMGGIMYLIAIAVWGFWYKSTEHGYAACLNKEWIRLQEAVKYIKFCLYAQYAQISIYAILMIVAIIILVGIEDDDQWTEDEKDFLQVIILYFVIIPLVIGICFIICFICAARTQRDMAQNLFEELSRVGAVQGIQANPVTMVAGAGVVQQQQQQQMQFQQQQPMQQQPMQQQPMYQQPMQEQPMQQQNGNGLALENPPTQF